MRYLGLLLLLTIGLNADARTWRLASDWHPRFKSDTDTIIRKQSASVGVSYGSDASFFGRTGPVKYPYFTADAIYNTKNGFFVYGSVWKVKGSEPTFDELDLGGGYLFTPSKTYSASVSYTRFFFNRYAEIIKSASSNDINVKNSVDFKLFKTSVVVDALFGESHDFFITWSNSKYFETSWSIFDDKDYLSFNPAVNIIVGTQNFVQKYSLNHQSDDYTPPLVDPNDPKFARRNSELNMLNYSFKLPIAYNRPHYTLEAAWKYSIPVNVEGQLHNHKETFFNLTFYYVFY